MFMPKKIATGLAAAAVALSGLSLTSVPAQARMDDGDLAAILAGAAAVTIIANSNRNYHEPRYDSPEWRRDYHRFHRMRPLPARCMADVRVRHGRSVRVFSAHCLSRMGYRWDLPRSCERVLRTNRGERLVYDNRCLTQRGYRVSYR